MLGNHGIKAVWRMEKNISISKNQFTIDFNTSKSIRSMKGLEELFNKEVLDKQLFKVMYENHHYPLSSFSIFIEIPELVPQKLSNKMFLFSFFTDDETIEVHHVEPFYGELIFHLFPYNESGMLVESIKPKNIDTSTEFYQEIIKIAFNNFMFFSYKMLSSKTKIIKEKGSKNNTVKNVLTKPLKQSSKIQIQNKTIICENVKNDENSNVVKIYQRHTETWNVRGHFRKYKSGKEVWIKPYKKGKKGGDSIVHEYII